jgi:hypothetical protein
MSAPPSTKRQRTKTIGDSASGTGGTIPVAGLVIETLPVQTVRELLAATASHNPRIAGLVPNEHKKIIAIQQAKVIDFDHLFTVSLGNHQCHVQPDERFQTIWSVVWHEIKRSKLHKGDRKREYSPCCYGTKKSVLETLRKIRKTIVLSTGTIEHEDRNQLQYEMCLEKAMLRIARSIATEERVKVLTQEFEKLEEQEASLKITVFLRR